MELKTLYTVLMLKKGFLGNTAIYPTLAHTPEVLELYRKAVDEVFGEIADILKKGNLEAVSYTHLDVYKRQPIYCTLLEWRHKI